MLLWVTNGKNLAHSGSSVVTSNGFTQMTQPGLCRTYAYGKMLMKIRAIRVIRGLT